MSKIVWFPPYVPPEAVETATVCDVPRIIMHRLGGYAELVPMDILDATGLVWFDRRTTADMLNDSDGEATETGSKPSDFDDDETLQLTADEVIEERDREEDERLEEMGAEEEEEASGEQDQDDSEELDAGL